jgi:hypothetical protein
VTLRQLESLSGAEVVARLVNRGMPVEMARRLADRRDHEMAAIQILRVLDGRRR